MPSDTEVMISQIDYVTHEQGAEQMTGDPSVVWEAHFAGIEKGYCHMEKMANLDQIPEAHGFKVACFPINIRSASAGWVRPVAIVDALE